MLLPQAHTPASSSIEPPRCQSSGHPFLEQLPVLIDGWIGSNLAAVGNGPARPHLASPPGPTWPTPTLPAPARLSQLRPASPSATKFFPQHPSFFRVLNFSLVVPEVFLMVQDTHATEPYVSCPGLCGQVITVVP